MIDLELLNVIWGWDERGRPIVHVIRNNLQEECGHYTDHNTPFTM